jgi:hypothetical protein
MEKPGPMCKAFRAYAKAFEERQGIVGNEVKGSLERSLECGCEYCMMACKMMGKRDEMVNYKKHNPEVVAGNSKLAFSEDGNSRAPFREVILLGEFSKSGLTFRGDPAQREVSL